ncbi:MAG TPA: hypothetical protein VJ885_17395 [Thermoanaerobaculia bacterium]|jgi:hypothetical protein|nr:hypothetical protein [Thermoanaerobaculia bacterium]
MFYSVSRAAFAFVLVLVLAVSAVPAQAQPYEFESSAFEPQDSWLDAAISWFQSFLPGGDELSVVTMGGGKLSSTSKDGDGNVGTMSSSCIDPMGNPCVDIP